MTAVEPLCADAAAITFEPPESAGTEFAFRPGQSLTIRRTVDGREERRSYSICSPVGGPLRIGVREVVGGTVSGWLTRQVRPGEQVEALPPTGRFTPDLNQPAHHVLLGAGSGITPLLSIGSSVLARSPDSRVTLIYGNRTAESVMFADDVADLKDRFPARCTVAHVLSREAQEVELFSGRLDPAKLAELLPVVAPPATVHHWWLCGPYAMVTGAIDTLVRFDVPASRIHRELFFVEDQPHERPAVGDVTTLTTGSTVTATLDGRATTATVAFGTPILDGLQPSRPDLPFACKGGVCGTCRARLVGGEVVMRRNFALEPAEVEAGFVLTCQSECVTSEVTVDYDA